MVQVRDMAIYNYVGHGINEFLQSKYNKSESERTRKSYENNLRHVLNDWFGLSDFNFITVDQLESVTLHNVMDYFNKLKNMKKEDGSAKFSNSTLNARMTSIKELYKYLNGWEYISYDVAKLDMIKAFSNKQEEIEMIPFDLAKEWIEATKSMKQGTEKSLLIELAIETALRVTELLELEWGNFTVVEDGAVIKSFAHNKGKGNKEFTDKISLEFYNKLLVLKELGNNKRLFNLTARKVELMIKELNTKHNNTDKKYSFHSFKKLAVTLTYINSGNCIYTAMKKARHENPKTTMKYLRLTNLAINGAISLEMTTEDELYKKVSHDELLAAISDLSPELKLLLNKKIKENAKV